MGETSIDIDEVAKSVREEFKTLYPLSDESSTYRVPERLRRLNEKAYTLKVVSIGPLHHGSKQLQAIEELKRRYLQDFLQRTKELFDQASIDSSFAGNENRVTMITLTQKFSTFMFESFSIEDKLDENIFSTIEHFVDVIKVCLQPPDPVNKKTLKALKAPSAIELHHAGVKFEVGSSSQNLFKIKFNNGVLEIPRLRIVKSTELLFRNAMAFEECHSPHTYITDYVSMMELLVISPKDVDLLVQKEIIENWLADGEAVTSLFHNLIQETPTDLGDFYFSKLVEDLNSYCKDPWHRWKATLQEEYFKTPWAVVSIIAAVILPVLSFIQAVCSVLPVVFM